MEHINIIAQEEIATPLEWPVLLVGGLAIAAMVGIMIYLLINPQNANKIIDLIFKVGFGGLLAMLIVAIISIFFFQVPTGRYRYEATIDKDNITVAEYEQFIEEYNPIVKDGIYYWEDKAE